MYERFSDRARKAMALANQEAQHFGHEYIGTEHILLGLLKEGTGVGVNVLENLNVDLSRMRLEVERLAKRGPGTAVIGKLPQTPEAKKVIEHAIQEARGLNHHYVGTEHLLLGLFGPGDELAAQVLANLGQKLDAVRAEVARLRGAGSVGTVELIGRAFSLLASARDGAVAEGNDALAAALLAPIEQLREIIRRTLSTPGDPADGS